MTFSYMHFGLKIRGIGTKTKKMKFIGGGKVLNKSCWEWFKLLFQIFFILVKSKKLSSYGPKTLVLTNYITHFTQKMRVFWPYLLHF